MTECNPEIKELQAQSASISSRASNLFIFDIFAETGLQYSHQCTGLGRGHIISFFSPGSEALFFFSFYFFAPTLWAPFFSLFSFPAPRGTNSPSVFLLPRSERHPVSFLLSYSPCSCAVTLFDSEHYFLESRIVFFNSTQTILDLGGQNFEVALFPALPPAFFGSSSHCSNPSITCRFLSRSLPTTLVWGIVWISPLRTRTPARAPCE